MRGDLALAAKVQQSLLPKILPAFPGLELAGWMRPSDAVGGDYLDFLSTAEFGGRGLGVVVGDISGHGPASALLMTAARAILRIRAAQPGSLAEIIGGSEPASRGGRRGHRAVHDVLPCPGG